MEKGAIERVCAPDYFLMARDIVDYARKNGIAVGPGRGAAASSIIAYGLGITGIDPLKYGLLFERFLNEAKGDVPDIDINVEDGQRDRIIDFIAHSKERQQAKIDVFELGVLSRIAAAVKSVKAVQGIDLDIGRIPLDDKRVFDMLSRGNSDGVFQCESEEFRRLLSEFKPVSFEDLVALIAVYRPGVSQFADRFVSNKNGQVPISYPHERMEPILRETYGLILYQEQVQVLAKELAGFPLQEGDMMRRAIGLRDARIMAKYRRKFLDQARDGIGSDVAEEVYTQIEDFAGYSINKAHTACYALISYQTAYLKSHYPSLYLTVDVNVS